VSVQQRGFLFEIKSCEINNHRHISDISESGSLLTGGLFFEDNAEVEQKNRFWMDTSYGIQAVDQNCTVSFERSF